MKKNKFNYLVALSLFLASGFLFGCGSDDTAVYEANNYNNPSVPVSISVSGADWFSDESSTRSGSSSIETVIVPMDNGYSLCATLEPAVESQTRATAVAAGVRYRVVAYRNGVVSAANYVNHADYEVGGASGQLLLPVNCTYTLVCYSYGSAAALPAFDKNSTDIAVTSSNDMLYCKKDITVTDVNTSFSILFSHLFSKVTVIADASVDGYNVTACTGSLSPNYSATASLVDGSLVKGTSAAKSLGWSSLGTPVVTSDAAVVYTAGETVTLTFATLSIGTTPVTNLLNKSITFTGKTMEAGKSYTLRVGFKQAPGIVVPGINVYWAKGNVRSLNSGATFSFYPNQYDYSGVWNGGDYFCWNTLNPLSLTSSNTTATYDPATDPCTKVAPAGTWRTPTKAEQDALIAAGSVWGTYGGKNGRFFGTTTVPAEADKSKYVFMPAAGYRSNGSTTMGSVGTNGGYWSATPDGATDAYFLYFLSTNASTNSNNRDFGFTVRCVSDK